MEGVEVGVLVGVGVLVAVGVAVGVLVGVFVGELVGVTVGVLVAVFVGVLVGVLVGVTVGVLVGVTVGVLVAVGADPDIRGIFQGTYPEFYGGDRIEAFLGLNGHMTFADGTMARLGVEAGLPLYQDLNGPQLQRDWSLAFTAGVHF